MKLKLIFFVAATAAAGNINANGFDEQLLERNRALEEMNFKNEQLKLQASMAKSFKEMNDAGFIVDPQGTPLGIGDMERLALEVRRRGGMQGGQPVDPNDPFGGLSPVTPVPPQNGVFTAEGGFQPLPDPNAVETPKKEAAPAGVEEVSKPTENEKAMGKKVLRLVEVRANSVTLFTNEGFQEVRVGQKVYDQRLKSVGVDTATLAGPDGDRVLRIDWTKSVRYSDD